MKIIAPIRNAEQYSALTGNGAAELYGGLFMPEWYERYGDILEYNRRGNFGKQANFTSIEELRTVLEMCRKDHIDFYLTCNAIFLSSFQRDLLDHLFTSYAAIGGKHVIVSDAEALSAALKAGCSVTVSSCADIYNVYSARFWYEAGARRLILPRNTDTETIAEIRRVLPRDCELEVFIMNSICKYSDGMCRSLHNTKAGALCSFYDNGRKSYIGKDGNEITGRMASPMQAESFFYQQLYAGNSPHGCGQCAIWDLMNAGVDSLKIVGRLLHTNYLEKTIRLTMQNMKTAENASSRKEYFEKMQTGEELLDQNLCRNGYRCYYREIRRGSEK